MVAIYRRTSEDAIGDPIPDWRRKCNLMWINVSISRGGEVVRSVGLIRTGFLVTMNPFETERRRHKRFALRLDAYLSTGIGERIMPVVTQDISAGGFRCFSPETLTPEESVDCLIALAGEDLDDAERPRLWCMSKVLRVEPSGDAQRPFAISCQIQEYKVIQPGKAAFPFFPAQAPDEDA